MRNFKVVSLSLLITSALAAPFDLVSKRPLASHEWARSSSPMNPRANCPALLPAGDFEFPHYITQISASEPDKAFGNQYNGVFTPNDISSIFSFDIPASRADANCTLEFIFPKLEDLKTSTFTYSGGGNFVFEGYAAGSCPGGWHRPDQTLAQMSTQLTPCNQALRQLTTTNQQWAHTLHSHPSTWSRALSTPWRLDLAS